METIGLNLETGKTQFMIFGGKEEGDRKTFIEIEKDKIYARKETKFLGIILEKE